MAVVRAILLFLLFGSAFGCRHNRISNDVNLPELQCGWPELKSDRYYVQVLDVNRVDPISSDSIVDLEGLYKFLEVPQSQQVEVNSKGCFEFESKWEKAYIFNFNRHQGVILRLKELKKGEIETRIIEQVDLNQEMFLFRECDHLTYFSSKQYAMTYDLYDSDGFNIEPGAVRAFFSDGSITRKVELSRGGCVALDEDEKGFIYLESKGSIWEFPVSGREGASEPLEHVKATLSNITQEEFEEMISK